MGGYNGTGGTLPRVAIPLLGMLAFALALLVPGRIDAHDQERDPGQGEPGPRQHTVSHYSDDDDDSSGQGRGRGRGRGRGGDDDDHHGGHPEPRPQNPPANPPPHQPATASPPVGAPPTAVPATGGDPPGRRRTRRPRRPSSPSRDRGRVTLPPARPPVASPPAAAAPPAAPVAGNAASAPRAVAGAPDRVRVRRPRAGGDRGRGRAALPPAGGHSSPGGRNRGPGAAVDTALNQPAAGRGFVDSNSLLLALLGAACMVGALALRPRRRRGAP